MSFPQDFGPFGERIWLNCAHQGAIPKVAAAAGREAIGWKVAPYELTAERFSGVPARLRQALARLLNASSDEIILGNSASYGLHLLANGIPWNAGDEVLLVHGDFPSDILPWLGLADKGVTVRYIHPRNHLPDVAELQASIGPATRLFCTTWVHSFSGVAANLDALGEVCRAHGVIFVVNGSQAVGARPANLSNKAVDALVGVGFKWLCGPYGTGYCWIRPELLRKLKYNQAYWLETLTAEDLGRDDSEISLPHGPPTARTFDVFGTANFFNFHTWTASIDYLLEQGIEGIARHDQGLISRLIDGLEARKYEVLSPRSGEARSTLVFLSHREPKRNEEIYRALKSAGIEVAFRKGKLRFAPHLYNTATDIDSALDVLNAI
jgi:cysteine desulfurase/selenocysteine lyase